MPLCQVRVLDYAEHAISEGANAKAVAYVEMRIDGQHTVYGVGMDANIVSASIRAIVSGVQRVGFEQHSFQTPVTQIRAVA